MVLVIFLTLVFCVAALAFFWVRKKYSFFRDHGYHGVFPYGNLKGMMTKSHPVYIIRRIYNKFKGKAPACGLFRLLSPGILILDLDLVRDILIRDFDNFHNRGIYYNEKDDPLSAHMFNLEDNAWKSIRTKLTPTFTSGKMKMMFNIVLEVSNHMVDQLKTEASLDMIEVKEVLAKFTTDVIGNVAFGLEMNAIKDPDSEFRRMGRKVFSNEGNIILKFLVFTTFKKIARKLGGRIFDAELTEFFMKIVRETIDYRVKNKIQRNDFMDLMLKLYNENELTFNEVTAQCFLFFIAGFETSSSTSTFVLYNLALHLDIQEKLRNEIKTVIEKHDNKITYEAMNEMKYLSMVIDGEFLVVI